MQSKRLMTIFAHQDDETFSAGGVLAISAPNGWAVSVTFDKKREEEFVNACTLLGVIPKQLQYSSVNALNEHKIREELIRLIREIKPEIVITHLENDYHHEHRYVRKIVEEAVEWASHNTERDATEQAYQIQSLWAAETTVLISVPHLLIDTSRFHKKQLEAIRVYESQSHKGGEGFYSNFHAQRTRLRGIQAGTEYAEAFVQVPIVLTGSFKPDNYKEFF